MREASVLRQGAQHVGSDCLLKLVRFNRLRWSRPNPRIRSFALPGLLEALD